MGRWVVMAALAAASPAWAGDYTFGVGPSFELGGIITGLTVGWAGGYYAGVATATGIGCFGGRGFVEKKEKGIRIGAEGSYCRDLAYWLEAEWWYAGASVGLDEYAGNRTFGGAVGFGYGQADERTYGFHGDFLYIRPKAYAAISSGIIGAEAGVYLQLPIYLTQQVDDQPYGVGWTPWLGLELTFYLGRLDPKPPRAPDAPPTEPAPAEPVPAEPVPL